MSESCITETATIVPLPMGNYEQIFEYEQSKDFNVTLPEREITSLITSLDPLAMGIRASNFLKRQLESLDFETNTFWRIKEVERDPQFVIDITIAIPNFSRKKKFAALSMVGKLMRAYPNLLFDFRTTKKRDIPEGYSVV